ncbi:MAG: hypothetical protein IIZ27_09845 [Solobacterium sp.]|nr:hypothetical protein [Solobacterium sp.]
MTQQNKFILTTTLIMLGYAYAFSMYTTPAVVLGISAGFLSVQAHSLRCLKNRLFCIFLDSIVISLLCHRLSLSECLPVLPFLGLANVLCAEMFYFSSFKVLDKIVMTLGMIMTGFLAAALILPENVMYYFMNGLQGTKEICIIILMIFLPYLKIYAEKVFRARYSLKGMVMNSHLR